VIGKNQRHEARLPHTSLIAGSDSRHALDDGVVGRAVAVWPVLAKPREGADDQAWKRARKSRRVEPEPLERGGPHVRDKHVGLAEQPIQHGSPHMDYRLYPRFDFI
jgi:hypothetical protein